MKTQTHTNLVIRSGLILALALVVWSPVQAQSTEPAGGKMMKDDKMMEPHHAMTESKQAMMQRHEAMMAEMKAQDAELTAQVAKMNSAPADKKLDLIAAIVTRLVEQRTAMNACMEMMPGEMMQHKEMGKESMSEHPMMKGMDEKPADAPKEQK
jgi:hypothetical protein